MKVWIGNEMERRGREWDWEITAGQIRNRVPYMVGATACATVPPVFLLFLMCFFS